MLSGAACCHCEESARASNAEISLSVGEQSVLPQQDIHDYPASKDEHPHVAGAEQHGTGRGQEHGDGTDAQLCAGTSGEDSEDDGQDKEEVDDMPRAVPASRDVDRSETLRSKKELELLQKDRLSTDVEILRGIDLRKSLRAAGLLWRKSPVDMKESERAALWTKSRMVDYFDVFLSHTWWTSGRRKVLALLFQTGLLVAAMWYFVTLALVLALYVLGALPMPGMYTAVSGGEEINIRLGPFLIICCPVGALLGLLTSPYMPHVLSKPAMCFLDVVSIHQTDEDLKTRGVYGLGGFLKSSKELRVLWSEPYLSRLWCVFELAAYKKSNPAGNISFRPLYIEAASFLAWLGAAAVASAGWLCVAFNGSQTQVLMVYSVGVLPVMPLIHVLRRNSRAKHKLLDDLASFDLNNVSCRSDFDREFVYSGISDWYGSTRNFTEYVRGPLRAEFVNKVNGSGMPLPYTLPAAGMAITLGLEIGIGMYLAGASAYAVACLLVGLTLGFCTLWVPVSIKFLMILCNHFAMARSSRALDVAQTIVLWFAFLLCFGFGAGAASITYKSSLGMTIGWAIFAALALWFAFDGARRLGKCCGAGKSSEGAETEETVCSHQTIADTKTEETIEANP